MLNPLPLVVPSYNQVLKHNILSDDNSEMIKKSVIDDFWLTSASSSMSCCGVQRLKKRIFLQLLIKLQSGV